MKTVSKTAEDLVANIVYIDKEIKKLKSTRDEYMKEVEKIHSKTFETEDAVCRWIEPTQVFSYDKTKLSLVFTSEEEMKKLSQCEKHSQRKGYFKVEKK